MEDVIRTFENANGQEVPYAVRPDSGRAGAAAHWLRSNPHRLHLGQVGLVLLKEDGTKATIEDIENIHQQLDLWTGKIDSRYTVEGEPVRVELYSHQNRDQISVRIHSPLIAQGRLRLKLRFSYGSDCHVCPGYDYSRPNEHETIIIEDRSHEALLQRNLDETTYFVDVKWEGAGNLVKVKKHNYELMPG